VTTIIVTHEDNSVDEFAFESGQNPIAIGRRSGNDVCIPSLSVSGRHARVVFEDDSVWLEDLQSTNGTYFNGLLVRRHPLRDGDEVILGKIRIRFANLYDREMESNSDPFSSSLDDPGPLERAQVAGPATGSAPSAAAGHNGARVPAKPDLSSPGLSAAQLNEHPTQTLTQKVSEPRSTDSRSQGSTPTRAKRTSAGWTGGATSIAPNP